ncbi:hypothetical protein F4777DRAFT_570019 [Nemania sp. FL0916]|nr:hypothetical protein F4777DRAFT_570019 [Nemania sp. FL0916]
MPPEVITAIYMELPTFQDIFALATTCSHLNAVWCANTTSIFQALAPSEIGSGFLKWARQLLADQGGASTDSASLTAHDVRRMVRNAFKADKAAYIFGTEVAARVPSCDSEGRVDFKYGYHPSGLTSTEYPRFISAYYRACSLLELGPSRWKERYESFTLRQFYRTLEMFELQWPIGEEIWINRPHEERPWHLFWRNMPSREALVNELDKHQGVKEIQVHGEFARYEHWPYAARMPCMNGSDGFLCLWDHFQENFYQMIVPWRSRNSKAPKPRPYEEFIREEAWGDSSDEETLRKKYRPTKQERQLRRQQLQQA